MRFILLVLGFSVAGYYLYKSYREKLLVDFRNELEVGDEVQYYHELTGKYNSGVILEFDDARERAKLSLNSGGGYGYDDDDGINGIWIPISDIYPLNWF